MTNVINHPRKDRAQERGQSNAMLNAITERHRFFIKNDTLHEVEDPMNPTWIKRHLTVYWTPGRGWWCRWGDRGGMAFAAYFHDVKFISDKEAKEFEKKLRADLKIKNQRGED